MIKKGIIWIISILVVLVIIGWGIYILRQQQSYGAIVHKKSKALLTISLDDILLNQFFDKWQTAPSRGQDFAKKLNRLKDNGIDIKANVFLFSLEETPKSFYAFFDLKDEQQFLTFLKEGLAIDSIERNAYPGVNYAYQETHKIAFVWKGKELLVGLGFDLVEKRDEMLQLIRSDEGRITIEKFIHNPSTLTQKSLRYSNISTNNFVEFELKGNRIDVAGEFTSKAWNFPNEYLVRELVDQHYIGKGWLNFSDIQFHALVKNLLRDMPLETDSIMAHARGNYLDIEVLKNKVAQRDTIISYAVDENFETVEEMTAYDSKVPEIRLGIQGDEDLSRFLPNKLFYQWFQKGDGQHTILSTSSTIAQQHSKYHKTDDLAHLAIHLSDWPNEFKLSSILLLKTIASDLNLTLKVTHSDKLVLRGKIQDYSR